MVSPSWTYSATKPSAAHRAVCGDNAKPSAPIEFQATNHFSGSIMKLKQIVVSVLSITALILSTSASAQKTYTPAQLQRMVQSGSYPKQGAPSTQTLSIDYVSCIAKVESIVASVRPNYPAQTVASTNLMRIEKVWTNDAAMTLSCSASDRKLVITSAPYL